MKKACYVLGIIVIVAGLVGAVILAHRLGVTVDIVTSGSYYKFTETVSNRDWGTTIGIFVGVLFPSIVLGIMLFAFSDILEKLDAQATIIEKFTPLLKNMPNEELEKKILADGGWKCPECGNVNRSYTNECKCGLKKDFLR